MTTERARASLTSAAPPLRPADPGVAAPPPVTPAGPTRRDDTWSPGSGGTALATSPTGVPVQPTAQPPRRRRGVLIGAGAVVVVTVAAVIALTALPGSGGNPSGESGSSSSATTTVSSAATASSPAATDTSSISVPASTDVSSTATGTGAMPQAYLGHWSGTMTSNTGAEGPQTAKLNLTGGAAGSMVGTVSYANGPCTYNLLLVSSAESGVELQEQVTSGPCFSDYAVVKLSGGKLTDNVYLFSPSGSPDLTGTLVKTS